MERGHLSRKNLILFIYFLSSCTPFTKTTNSTSYFTKKIYCTYTHARARDGYLDNRYGMFTTVGNTTQFLNLFTLDLTQCYSEGMMIHK